MRRLALVSVISLLFLSGCSQEVITNVEQGDPSGEPSASATTPSPSESGSPSAGPDDTASPTPEPTQSATALLSPGDSGDKVRELQHRLLQLGWFEGQISGEFDDKTRLAVEGFQGKRGLPVLGFVDQATMDSLTSMTRKPTEDEKNNVLKPGPALMAKGASGDKVKDLQARLKQIGWYGPDVNGEYDDTTVESVKGFQGKRANSGMTLDDRCLQGRVLCISKSQRKLSWVIDGQVQMTLSVRFGSDETPTRNGVFSVGWKSRDHVSTLYHTPMPYAMFFSGGQAVHYSADFAQNGYNGASHGCVNVRDKGAIASLFDQVRVGDKVVVYAD